MNRVSVIIPCYNRCGLVNETVRNVLSQSLAPFEVIVVDDGSTDDSVRSLQDEFGNRIQLIAQSNQGPGAARNAGLNIASGEFVWLMDSDDLSSLNKLETQVAALETHNADVVYSPWVRVYFQGRQVKPEGPVLQQTAVPATRDVLTWFMTDWSLVFQHCLFRRSILEAAGRYRTDMWTCDDSEYFVRVLTQEAKIVFDDKSLTLYRCDDHGKVTGSGFQNSRRMIDWAKCLIAMYDFCRDRQKIVRHPEFQLRLWKSLKELSAHCPDEDALTADLKARLQSSYFVSSTRLWSRRIGKAIRIRTGGTHWSAAHQTGPLNSHQARLICELGYGVSIAGMQSTDEKSASPKNPEPCAANEP